MTYGDGLLTVTPEGLTIDTGLSAREAGTAKLSQYQTETGVIITVQKDGTVEYSSWSWTGSHEDIAAGRKVNSVFVDGEAFDGKPLLTLFEEAEAADGNGGAASENTARTRLAGVLNALSAAVEDAAGKDVYLPDNGPFGTLVADDGRILLLPENVFIRSISSRSDRDASHYAGCWKNTALQGIDGWRFTLACYAYRYLSGRNAFPQEDTNIRTADYFDKNFIPLDWFCSLNGIAGDDADKKQAELFEIIRLNLSKAAPVQETEKQKKKAARRSAIELSKSYPLPELPLFESRECRSYALSSGYLAQQKKLKRTRFVRRNALAIKWYSIGALVLIFFAVSFIKDKLEAPSTKGMEPATVLEVFYDSFDQLNATMFDATHTNSCASEMSNYLSTMFVTSKMRQSYENMGNYTMNQWLSTKVLYGTYIFGITNLTFTPIGKEPPLDVPADTDDEFAWKVHYYIVYNMGNEEFSYIDQTDIITITWRVGRWMVSDFETVQSIPHDDADLTLMMEAVTQQPEEYDLYQQGSYLLSKLKDSRPWMPTEAEIEKGIYQLTHGWNPTEYQKVINSVLGN